jgi:hypothetical protein
MKKNIILMALAVAAFTACEKSAPYEPGAPMDLDKPNVYFSAYNATKTVLASDATEFEVALLRDDVETALTLPLKSACTYDGIFTAPETVEFPAGVDSISFKVQVSEKLEMFKDYQLFLTVPEEYTHAYAVSETGPRYIANVVKEDYYPYAEGYFVEPALLQKAYGRVLEYSPLKEEYRIKNAWMGGTTLAFGWDGENKVTPAKQYSTGLTYGNYGIVTVKTKAAAYTTIPADILGAALPGFAFVFDYTVSAGTLGEDIPNYFAITKVL